MIKHIRSLQSAGRHSMAGEVIMAMEDMSQGGDGDGSRQYYKGWTDSMFSDVLAGIK